MSSDDWDKLPLVKNEYHDTDLGRIPLDVYPHGMSLLNYAKQLHNDWSSNKGRVLHDTQAQEDLVGFVMAIAISYMTHDYHLPARIKSNNPNNAIDRMVVTGMKTKSMPLDTEGSAFQIVCTEGEPIDSDRDANVAILNKIAHKHKKGQPYADGLQLVVFVTQEDWKIDGNALLQVLKKNSIFSSYWILSVMNDKKTFVVNNLNQNPDFGGRGQIVVDFSDGIKARHLYLFLQDGKLDDVVEFLKHFSKNLKKS